MLFNIPFGAVQLVATMGSAWLATVWRMKGPVLALLCLPPIAGCVMLLQITHDDAHKGPLLAAYYIVSIKLSGGDIAERSNQISVYPAISELVLLLDRARH
jgi:hypothetical protein